ncbi:GNAT family acetyltransferase [Colletotrichum asianum]
MSSNPLLHLQFPTPASIAHLHDHLAQDTLRHLAASRVLVARSSSSSSRISHENSANGDNASSPSPDSSVASFVKWDLVGVPTLGSERLDAGEQPQQHATAAEQQGGEESHYQQQHQKKHVVVDEDEREDVWPVSANQEYLTAYSTAASSARKQAMGTRPFVHLTFLCTDDGFRGRGAGTALVRAVSDEAASRGLPVFLESTMDAAQFYKKLGFAKVGGFRISIPAKNGGEETYEEVCMLLEADAA